MVRGPALDSFYQKSSKENFSSKVFLKIFKLITEVNKMTEVLQKGQKIYSLNFTTKHNFFGHFCAYPYVRNHYLSRVRLMKLTLSSCYIILLSLNQLVCNNIELAKKYCF